MKTRGDGEISGKTVGAEGVPAQSFTGLEVGASLTDLLIGKQPDTIKLAPKTNSLETADSALFSAIISGDTDFVMRRMNATGNMGEGAALLLIKARQKAAERSFINELLAHSAQTTAEGVRKKDGSQFTNWTINMAAYEWRERRTEEKKADHNADIMAGFLDGFAYKDRFGGTYTAAGYHHSNGSFTAITGEHYDKATNTFHVGAESFQMRSTLAEIDNIGEIVVLTGKAAHASTQDLSNVYRLAEELKMVGADDNVLKEILIGLKKGVIPSGAHVEAAFDLIRSEPGGAALIEGVFKDAQAQSMMGGLLSYALYKGGKMFGGGTPAVPEGPVIGDLVAPAPEAPVAPPATAADITVSDSVAPAARSSYVDMSSAGTAGKSAALSAMKIATATDDTTAFTDQAVASAKKMEEAIPDKVGCLDMQTFIAQADAVEGGALDVMRKHAPEELQESPDIGTYKRIADGLADRKELAESLGKPFRLGLAIAEEVVARAQEAAERNGLAEKCGLPKNLLHLAEEAGKSALLRSIKGSTLYQFNEMAERAEHSHTLGHDHDHGHEGGAKQDKRVTLSKGRKLAQSMLS